LENSLARQRELVSALLPRLGLLPAFAFAGFGATGPRPTGYTERLTKLQVAN